MKVYVAGIDDPDCPAHLTLAAEGLPHETVLLGRDRPTAYSEWFRARWKEGTGFILVEHDIAPWPGAVRQLANCGRDWCAFPYPWCIALGLVKFSGEFTRQFPGVGRVIAGEPWQGLDMKIIGFLQDIDQDVHVHEPAVAHVRKTPPRAAHNMQAVIRAADV
jgi:hypothetical protein